MVIIRGYGGGSGRGACRQKAAASGWMLIEADPPIVVPSRLIGVVMEVRAARPSFSSYTHARAKVMMFTPLRVGGGGGRGRGGYLNERTRAAAGAWPRWRGRGRHAPRHARGPWRGTEDRNVQVAVVEPRDGVATRGLRIASYLRKIGAVGGGRHGRFNITLRPMRRKQVNTYVYLIVRRVEPASSACHLKCLSLCEVLRVLIRDG